MSTPPLLEEIDESARFPNDFFLQPVEAVARNLLGACLVSTVDGTRCVGLIVETEAYGGSEDPASHASTASGVTRRNRAMFGPPGHAYVYKSYGMHWCMNVVTGPRGRGQAVLLRGVEPLEGAETMKRRRNDREPLAAGPGRLSQALGITDDLYGHDLSSEPLILLPGWSVPDERVGVSPRIGISVATRLPYRFYVRDSPGVSGPGTDSHDP